MLTPVTRLKIAAFALIGVVVIAYTGFNYAHLGRYLGLRGYYVVRLELANAGGIFPNAAVTYRGVPVGKVGALRLTASGVEADLDINDSAPAIPDRLRAVVADLSAVGEQYVDLLPQTPAGPFLTNGSVISQRQTALPLPVTSLLGSINTLATSVPLGALRTVTNELATGFAGQGANLQGLVDGNAALIRAAYAALPETTRLIRDSRTVLATQIAESGALDAFGANALLLARQLARSDASVRKLIVDGSQATAQVAKLLGNASPNLGVLVANLLTTSEVTLTRGRALDELLSVLPADIAIGSTVITSRGAHFGVALTFFDPLPCTTGYGGTQFRNGLDGAPGLLNMGARCTLPARSGIDVRGSAHAPAGGGVPPAARPGLAGLLGVAP